MLSTWRTIAPTTPTTAVPLKKRWGGATFQKMMAIGSTSDGDVNTGANNQVWKIAKGKPEAGKRGESINDPKNPDAHMDAAAGG
ncbi:MAG: hypothetical protein K8I29_07820 [Alphaproteobacteria bacterium]|uniref:Uncharacterized protein n=1 Tax=Candidatus Nitrobium versatile TaxID=2884831 RepID=A0A953M1R8_9BACT|nr:hypothetical protein [Candidatus Nitrobium versatile]